MKNLLGVVIVLCVLFSCDQPTSSTQSASQLEARVDSLIKPWVDSAKVAGVAVGVFKDAKPLMLKSYGYADLEHDVKLPVSASFEIGSVTKQFTGVAILQLVEQGKLSLEDDPTKYIKYDLKGKKVTIRQLLSHTSGIKGYTEMAAFGSIMSHKYKRDTLLRLTEAEPFDFEPGTALIYNNTAFFMLGLIIEKVSGMTYEDYVAKNLFEKAGMTNSYYCDETRITKNRAHGYDMGEKGLKRAAYLDHAWPYSAGSLCSTVEDLAKWNDALHHGKLLSDKSYQELITPVTIGDGVVTHYAKGLTVTEKNGVRQIEHGGGIFGFLSQNSYFPDENVSVIVLVNTTGPVAPATIANFIADDLFGKGVSEKKKYDGDLSKFLGTFKGPARGAALTLAVTKNDSTLVAQRDDGKPAPLEFEQGNDWTMGGSNFYFIENGGVIDEVRIDQTYGYYILKRVK